MCVGDSTRGVINALLWTTSTVNSGINFPNNALISNLSQARSTLKPETHQTDYKYAATFGRLTYNYDGKYLQIHVTVEDEGVFTTPWSATVTYVRNPAEWQEIVCAENRHEYYSNKDSDVPQADKVDF